MRLEVGPIWHLPEEAARTAGLEVVMDRCMKIEQARFFGGLSPIGLNTGLVSAQRRRSKP